MFVGSGPVIGQLDAQFWRLEQPLTYAGLTDTFVVPAGFRTDLASVPTFMAWLIPRSGVYTPSAILHDYLLKADVVSRADADGVFRRTMRELGVSGPRRWMMWTAVRFNSRLTGISRAFLARWAVIALLSVLFLAVPVVVVLAFQLLFWLFELTVWGIGRLGGGTDRPRPTFSLTT